MVFIFTGSEYKNKKIIQDRFLKFLRTERRNWRRTVFLIDENTFSTDNTDDPTQKLYNIVDFIHNNENDILVSLPMDMSEFVEKVKSNTDDFSITHFTDEKIKDKEEDIIYVNVTKYSVDNQYSKFIQKIERFF